MKMNLFFSLTMFFVLFFLPDSGFAQDKPDAVQVKFMIADVYGVDFEYTNTAVYEEFKKLLLNRISYVKSPLTKDDKYPKLSTIKIFNKNNPKLERDMTFNPATFNPLKYQLEFFVSRTKVYRFDNSDYLIVIQPQ